VHDLRHTCASLLIASGANINGVQAQLGHASEAVTLDRYGHLFPDELERLAERLDQVYMRISCGPSADHQPEEANHPTQRCSRAGSS
jgi:site-specific recombinase XerC